MMHIGVWQRSGRHYESLHVITSIGIHAVLWQGRP